MQTPTEVPFTEDPDTFLDWMENTWTTWVQAYQRNERPHVPNAWKTFHALLLDRYMERAWGTLPPWPDVSAERWSLGLLQWGLVVAAHAFTHEQNRTEGRPRGPHRIATQWATLALYPTNALPPSILQHATVQLAHCLLDQQPPLPDDNTYYRIDKNMDATWWGEMAATWTGLTWANWILSLYPRVTLKRGKGGRGGSPHNTFQQRCQPLLHERFHPAWKNDALWMLQKPHERWIYHWRHPEGPIKDPYHVLTTFRETPLMNSLDERCQRDQDAWTTVLENAVDQPPDPVNDAFLLAILNVLMRNETKLVNWRGTWVYLQHEIEQKGVARFESAQWPLLLHLQGAWYVWHNHQFIETPSLVRAWALWYCLIQDSPLPVPLQHMDLASWKDTFLEDCASSRGLPHL